MTRIFSLLLAFVLVTACSSDIENAKKLVQESIVIETELEFNEVYGYPGDTVCGFFSAYISYHDPKVEDSPFIVIDNELNRSPTDLDLTIYCSSEPADALMEESGIGPITSDNTAIIKIIQDFTALSDALESYYRDTFQYPSETQGLDALQTKPKGVKLRGQYKEGGYLQDIPLDPWGRPYRYTHVQWGRVKGTFELSTLGASNETGGNGLEADVSSNYLPYLLHVAKIQNL